MRRLLPLLLVFVACQREPMSTLARVPIAKLEPGWTTACKNGMTIHIPPGWKTMELPAGFEGGSAMIGGPQAEGLLGLMDPPRGKNVLFAASGDVLNLAFMTLVKEESEEVLKPKEEGNRLEKKVRSIPLFANFERRDVKLPVGLATVVYAELPRDNTGLMTVMAHYVLVDGRHRYTAMFIGLTGEPNAVPAGAIMETFRISG